jgi:hypothetical protein
MRAGNKAVLDGRDQTFDDLKVAWKPKSKDAA